MMSYSPKSPYQVNPVSDLMNRLYYDGIQKIPTQGKNFSDTLHANARQTNNIVSKVSQHSIAQIHSLLTSSVEFVNFEKTPELFGVNIPKLPLTFLILMFFTSMMPARVHSEILRAPKKDENGDGKPDGKDYRAIRDVIIRDVASISLFLFALDPVNHALLHKRQRDGSVFSLGKTKTPSLTLMTNTLNPRRGESSISYPDLKQIYYLHAQSPETFAKLAGMHSSNNNMHLALEEYLKGYKLWKAKPEHFLRILNNPKSSEAEKRHASFMLNAMECLNTQGKGMLTHLKAMSSQKNLMELNLTTAFKRLYPQVSHRLNEHPEALMRQLFDLKGLKTQADVQNLDADSLKAMVQTHLTDLGKALEVQSLQALPEGHFLKPATETPDYHNFMKQVHQVSHTGDLNAFNLMADKALNHQQFIDVATQAVMNQKPQQHGKPLKYSEVFNLLKNEHFGKLEDTVSALRASHNLLETLKVGDTASSVVKYLQGMYHHSAEAMTHVDALDSQVKRLQAEGKEHLTASMTVFGKRIGLPALDWASDAFKLQTFKQLDARQLLSRTAENMRSPVDFMGYMFVASVIGFLPVWLNQVVTETEYRLKKATQAPPRREEDPHEPKDSFRKASIS
jgi:hypothetical protein